MGPAAQAARLIESLDLEGAKVGTPAAPGELADPRTAVQVRQTDLACCGFVEDMCLAHVLFVLSLGLFSVSTGEWHVLRLQAACPFY